MLDRIILLRAQRADAVETLAHIRAGIPKEAIGSDKSQECMNQLAATVAWLDRAIDDWVTVARR